MTSTIIFNYPDEHNNLRYWKERIEKGKDRKDKEFYFYHNDKYGIRKSGRGSSAPLLYNLPQVIGSSYVFIVEGEKCADSLKNIGLVATSLDSGAQSPWQKEYEFYLTGKQIYIFPDNDETGEKYLKTIANNLYGKTSKLKVIRFSNMEEHYDIADWIDERKDKSANEIKAELKKLIKDAPEWKLQDNSNKTNTWEDIIPFKNHHVEEFPDPSITFAPWFGNFTKGLSAFAETPIELAIMDAMGALSVSVTKKIEIQTRPGFCEPLNQYLCVPLESGNRKTFVLNACIKPIHQWESEKAEEIEPFKKAAESKLGIQKAQIAALKRKLNGKNSDNPTLIREIKEIEMDLVEIPVPPKLWTSDITAEKLCINMMQNNGTNTIASDEGGMFDLFSGKRYNSG